MSLEQMSIETYNLQVLLVRLQIVMIVLLLAVMVLILWIALQASRQSQSLLNVYRLFEDWSMMIGKDRREARKAHIQIADPLQWFSKLSGVEVLQIIRKFDSPMALDLMTMDNRNRLVVSPLKPADLKSSLGSKRFKFRDLFRRDKRLLGEPLLGRREWRVRIFDRSNNNAGEFFDLEASEVGKMLGLNWGEATRLWFYLVPNK